MLDLWYTTKLGHFLCALVWRTTNIYFLFLKFQDIWSIKKIRDKKEKKIITLPCTKIKHVLPCAREKHTAKYGFACAKRKYTAKHVFIMCYIFVVCTHGKNIFYRVPNRKHTTNYWAYDDEPDSGSVLKVLVLVVVDWLVTSDLLCTSRVTQSSS